MTSASGCASRNVLADVVVTMGRSANTALFFLVPAGVAATAPCCVFVALTSGARLPLRLCPDCFSMNYNVLG